MVDVLQVPSTGARRWRGCYSVRKTATGGPTLIDDRGKPTEHRQCQQSNIQVLINIMRQFITHTSKISHFVNKLPMTLLSRSVNMESHKDTVRVLVLNPNSSTDMTHGVEEAIRSINLPKVSCIITIARLFCSCF